MTNQELVAQIEKLERNLNNPNLPESAKTKVKTTIDKLKEELQKAQEKVEEKQEKLEKQEEKIQDDVEAQIAKLEKNLNNPNLPESAKELVRKKIAAAKEKLAEQKKEIKEEKKEVAEEKKELKEAEKDVAKAEKEVEKAEAKAEKAEAKGEKEVKKAIRTTPIKKPKTKEKQREKKSESRKKELKKIISDLSALIEKNKKLRKKYEGKSVDLDRDAGRSAKPFGYRFKGKHDYRVPTEEQIKRGLKRGTIDYEGRPNRSDVYPKGYKGKIKLEDGGILSKAGATYKLEMWDSFEDMSEKKKPTKILYSELEDKLNDIAEKHQDVDGASRLYKKRKGKYMNISTFLEDGGMMKKGGDVQGKTTNKKTDGQKFAKPSGWRWKDEAERVIGKIKMSKSPSKFMRRKYPDLVYKETRPDKSDKNPSKKYISL